MNYKTTIILITSDLDNGETLRYLCPRCEGGSSGEKSLSVTRNEDGTLVWQCFRDKCPERGATGEKGVYVAKVRAEKPRREFNGTTKKLSDYHLARIKSLWGIEDPPYWYYTPDMGGRIAMSIRSPKYTHRGWVLRDIRGNAKVKALTYLDKDAESLSWYKTDRDAPTVVVEDIPSAVRAQQAGVNAVALLGTAMGVDKAQEIAEYGARPIVIALDQDATAKSFEHVDRFSLLWESTRILPLKKDLKDMKEVELCTLLSTLKGEPSTDSQKD